MELFDEMKEKPKRPEGPLADRMRPDSIADVVGQEHLLSDNRILSRSLKGGALPSLILWGPPGSGKATLGKIIAESSGSEFVTFSAVLSGVKEVREVIKSAKISEKLGKKTLLFVDEIHRFNKAQQDAFLHHVEDGTITLIGATTENPSFEINAPLLSRCSVLVLEKLGPKDIIKLLERALADSVRGLGSSGAELEDGVLSFLAESSDGDARHALNTLETAVMISAPDKSGKRLVSLKNAQEALQKKAIIYDKGGEEHYNIISAFIKSMRGSDPDAALYWLARMIEAGEDALFIARRMVIFASEDIGNADPRAITVALGVKEAVHFVGMPEGFIPLAQGATFLATSPKSNASYAGYKMALKDVKKKGALPVPLHIRNAPTKLMKDLGYGNGYQYPHNYEDALVEADYLPDELTDRRYYEPTGRGYEKRIKEFMQDRKTAGKKDKP